MSGLEIAATVTGLISVILTIRQHVGCWPSGLISVFLYIFIFYEAKLYADMGLQVVYVGLQLYGWYLWVTPSRGGAEGGAAGDLPVTTLSPLALLAWIGAGAAATIALGAWLRHATDASLPFLDATTTCYSLVAQWLLGKKKLESWMFWIGVDVLSVGMYYRKELYLTAGLYAVFLGLAVSGLLAWRRDAALSAAQRPA